MQDNSIGSLFLFLGRGRGIEWGMLLNYTDLKMPL
ncbi:hypothetical protein PS655_01515 [Pseudomonas fluorescens]|uniref:Uncharacterized protein n=1 Tax=Pseudomonas fluorescens TaxID=294 RepID=A0A5E6RBB1_PSEFL|nr:hypothetical protein PS655_01515 [Pseudomonas fluorescens]